MRDAIRAGVAEKRLERRDLVSSMHGVRVPAGMPLDLELRCRGLATRFREGDAFTGPTAAALYGAPLPMRLSSGPLHVVSRDGTAPFRRRGVVGSNRQGVAAVEVHGVPVVPPLEAALVACRQLAPHDVTAILDYLLTGDRGKGALLEAEELTRYLSDSRHIPGIAALRRAARSARRGAWSRPETLTRILFERAGLPAAELNVPLLLGGAVLVPDLAWHDYHVGLEYNGKFHDSASRHSRDLTRLDGYADHGWSVLNVERTELFTDPAGLVGRTARRLVARGWTGFRGYEIANSDRFEP